MVGVQFMTRTLSFASAPKKALLLLLTITWSVRGDGLPFKVDAFVAFLCAFLFVADVGAA